MTIRFEKPQVNFLSVLRKEVNLYFAQNQIHSSGNSQIIVKTIILFGVLIANYVLQLSGVYFNNWLLFGSYFIQGILFALIGFNVMHDGSHACYGSEKWSNRLAALSLNFLGGIALFWHQKHVVNHHTYTNIEGVDDDIDLKPFLRIHADQPYRPFHRFQAYYAFILYCLTYVFWIYYRDFKKYFTRKIAEDTKMTPLTPNDHLVFWLTKIGHFSLFVIIPGFVLGFKIALLGYITLCVACGFTLAIVFQLAHIVEGTTFKSKNEDDVVEVESEWAIYQIQTTVNFATKSKVLAWLLGGLNFQMVHHLFPKISHIHYPALHRIICDVCEKHGVSYLEYPTLTQAIGSHIRYLNQLGKGDS